MENKLCPLRWAQYYITVFDIRDVDKHLIVHVEYLKKLYSNGVLLAFGRKVPRTGGVILAQIDSLEALEKMLSGDLFGIHGLASYEVKELIPSKTSTESEFFS